MDEHDGTAVFGSFDGLTSVLGLIAALTAAPLHVLVAGTVGLALSSAVGMGAGSFLSDPTHNVQRALVMAGATAAGVLTPLIPFLVLSHIAAMIVALVITLVFGAGVAETRHNGQDHLTRKRAYAQTFSVLALALVAAGVGGFLGGA